MSQNLDSTDSILDKLFKDNKNHNPKELIVYGGPQFQEALTKALKESIYYGHYIEENKPSKKEYFKSKERYRKNLLDTPTTINDILKLKPHSI